VCSAPQPVPPWRLVPERKQVQERVQQAQVPRWLQQVLQQAQQQGLR
jgi:hypothetical protein